MAAFNRTHTRIAIPSTAGVFLIAPGQTPLPQPSVSDGAQAKVRTPFGLNPKLERKRHDRL